MDSVRKPHLCRIFFSFSSENGALADELYAAMCDLGKIHRVPLCIHYAPESIRWGVGWEQQLAIEIRNCDVLLVLWTPESRSAVWQLLEIGAGWILGKNLLAVLRNAKKASLPAPVLSQIQAIHWDEFNTQFSKILSSQPRRDKANEAPPQTDEAC